MCVGEGCLAGPACLSRMRAALVRPVRRTGCFWTQQPPLIPARDISQLRKRIPSSSPPSAALLHTVQLGSGPKSLLSRPCPAPRGGASSLRPCGGPGRPGDSAGRWPFAPPSARGIFSQWQRAASDPPPPPHPRRWHRPRPLSSRAAQTVPRRPAPSSRLERG